MFFDIASSLSVPPVQRLAHTMAPGGWEHLCHTDTFLAYNIWMVQNKSCYAYSKTCLKRPLKIDKTKTLKTNSSLMNIKSIAECSLGAF